VSKLLRFTIPALRRVSCKIGKGREEAILYGLLLAVLVFLPLPSFAQYSANIQGTVQDPSGAAVNGAQLHLINPNTGQNMSAVSNTTGAYRFLSLAPGSYRLEAQAAGFAKTSVTIKLETNQTLDLPVSLSIASANTTVAVTGEPPVLDTAESRNQLTIESDAVSELPLSGRNMISLVTMAPGVTGLGAGVSGSPGSGVDNYSTETQVDSSANGQGSVGNMYIIDGLEISSSIRAGVLNLTPNPDSIQETSIQVNTYSVEYGSASSIQMAMTTKGGGERFHGNASDYFSSQQLWAGTEFTHHDEYSPFHFNNISATIGGPIIPHHQTFFFFSIEPLRQSSASSGVTSWEDPDFTAWAKANYPNTIGTSILENYTAKKYTSKSVSQTALQAFGSSKCGQATLPYSIPCDTNVLDTGNFSGTGVRNGMQWNARIDKNFNSDRIYGSIYRTTLKTGIPFLRSDFDETQQFWSLAWQGNETHTFSSSTINEASVAGMRTEGIEPQTGDFKVPVINVTGLGTGFGDGFAMGDFIQHNYHWRDVLTHIHGAHTLKIGYEGWFGDDIEAFQGPHDIPVFGFNNLLDLPQDSPYTEDNIAYNVVTGKHVEFDWNAASRTGGGFVEDTWKARKNLTLNLGVRWDDFGNPYSRNDETVFGNFYLGNGTTIIQQITNGSVIQKHHALNRAITDVISPRLGLSWDILGNSKWVLHGGSGIFHNWPTPANEQEEFRGTPPGATYPTFTRGTSLAPVFGLGTSNTPPFGYTYPTMTGTPLNSHGGVTGATFGIGAIDPNLKSPVAYIYNAQLEHPLARGFVASLGYSGARAESLLSGGGQVSSVSYGVNINAMPNDPGVIANGVATRYNTSFGSIAYTMNDRHSIYNAFIADVRGRFAGTGFVDFSYTHSVSKDDTQVYPTWTNPQQYFAPSTWDAPNRVSFTGSYEFRGINRGEGLVGHVTGGWGLSGTMVGQSGTPFTVYTSANYASGGDYNANGDNTDYPDISSYNIHRSRKDFLGTPYGGKGGVFANTSIISTPASGTEGNEKYSGFRNPPFFETDAGLHKDTAIHSGVSLQIRFEFFNIFNHPNLQGVTTDLTSTNFGQSTSQYQPRNIQVGANLRF
jgi:hypothetical protein